MARTMSRGELEAIVTPFHVMAIGATFFRLYRRCHGKRRLWWDDYWAMSALTFEIIFLVNLLSGTDKIQKMTVRRHLIQCWLGLIMVPLIIWGARISIGMSIARIVPPGTKARWLLYVMNATFFLAGLSILLSNIILTSMDPLWKVRPGQLLRSEKMVAIGILSMASDFISDTCLIAVPFYMLWRVRLPRKQRRLILSIFASSVLNSLAGVVYLVIMLQPQTNPVIPRSLQIAVHIKAAVILMVCNLLVIVTYLYRTFWKQEGDDDVTEPDETRSKTGGAGKLTDVGMVPVSTDVSALTFTEISSGGTVQSPFSSFGTPSALESEVTTGQTGPAGLGLRYDEPSDISENGSGGTPVSSFGTQSGPGGSTVDQAQNRSGGST